MATLTVGITYFNEGPLLKECLESLLAQALPPDEILIYDDSSTEPPSPHIPTSERIRVIRGKENLGPSHGRNALLAASKGDYIHFHDADDWFDPAWSSRVRPLLDGGEVDAVFTEVTSHRDGKVAGERVVGFEQLATIGDLVRFSIRSTILVPCGTYRTEYLKQVGGYRPALWQSEDFDFHVRVAARQPRFRVIDEPLVHIRLRPQSRSQNFGETRVYLLKGLELLSNELPKKYAQDLAETAAVVGGQLFELGMKSEARNAFSLAARLGRPEYSTRPRFYRWVASLAGPMAAEEVSNIYRKVLPPSLRRLLR